MRGSAVSSTADDVKTAVNADTDAAALVTVSSTGDVSGIVSVVSPTFLFGGAAAVLTESDPLGVGSGDVSSTNFAAQKLKVISTPALKKASLTLFPDDAFAFLVVDSAGADNTIQYDAVSSGTGGNSITIEYEYLQVPSTALVVAVTGSSIKVTLATDAASVITSTAAAVIAAITGSVPASVLVTATAVGAVTGVIGGAFPATALSNARTGVVYTAITAGIAGNSITVAYTDPAAPTSPISVSVIGSAITVSLKTDGSSTITSTPTDIVAAVNGDITASLLVLADEADENAADGIVAAVAATPLDGGAGSTTVRDTILSLVLERSDLTPVTRLVTFSAGDPTDTEVTIGETAATVTIGTTVNNNAIKYTAVTEGTDGNDITIACVNPGTTKAALSVSVVENAITVSLETDNNGRVVSTANEVIAAVNGDVSAAELVTAENVGNGFRYVAVKTATNLTGGVDPERFLEVESVTLTEGGESGDQFTVRSIVEREITL